MDILDWVRAVVALIATLGLIGLAAIAARRLGMLQGMAAGQVRRMRVTERLMLDPRRSVVIVRIDSEEHVLLLSPFGERKLAEIANPPALAEEQAAPLAAEPAPPLATGVERRQAGDQANYGKVSPRAHAFVSRNFSLTRLRSVVASVARARGLVLALLLVLAFPALAHAQDAAPSINIDLGTGGGLTERMLQLVALVTVLSIAPSVLIMTTSFIRIVVVLSLLRTAIGLQQAPPNAVIISLALFLTAFVMQPTWQAAWESGVRPVMDQEMTLTEAFPRIAEPVKSFMLVHTREADLALFLDMAKLDPAPQRAEDTPLRVVIPAFMISELRRAFEIGFMLFIPFLVIDLVVSSLLMSMGMMMVPPVTISLPFKLIFFVLVDGWRLVAGSLVESFVAGAPPGG